MDDELVQELAAIEAGELTDPTRIRQVFAVASEELRLRLDSLYAHQDLLDRAQKAFLQGWPNRHLRAVNHQRP
jgi:hypothetical protein